MAHKKIALQSLKDVYLSFFVCVKNNAPAEEDESSSNLLRGTSKS